MARGVNRQSIFSDDEDRQRLVADLHDIAEEYGARVLAYCLMGNHFHAAIRVGKICLSTIMQNVSGGYARAYNRKHGRTGHLFEARFRAKLCADDAYLAAVIRYIHHNPVEAGLVSNPRQWPWSSAKRYPVSIDDDLLGFDPWRDGEFESLMLRTDEMPALVPISDVAARITLREGIDPSLIRSKSAVRDLVAVRRQIAAESKKEGHSGKAIAAWLGLSEMAVSRYLRPKVLCVRPDTR